MPIYEYLCRDAVRSCARCKKPFEVLQGVREAPLEHCPACGNAVRKIISRCRAAVVETPEEYMASEQRIKEYERAGMYSHAAELADKMAEKTGDSSLQSRAFDDYAKAGYDKSVLDRHAKPDPLQRA